MASGLFNRLKANLMNRIVDLSAGGHTIKCALLDSDYSFSADHNTYADVSTYEISGTGYTATGKTLTSQVVTQDDANDRAVFDAGDVNWPNSSITARYAVLYDDDLVNDDLIACFDFGSEQSSSNADFTIQWGANGILRIS